MALSGLNGFFQVIEKTLQTFLRHMLHDNKMGKFSAKPVVIIRSQVIFFSRFPETAV